MSVKLGFGQMPLMLVQPKLNAQPSTVANFLTAGSALTISKIPPATNNGPPSSTSPSLALSFSSPAASCPVAVPSVPLSAS
jgi:hypothetical protein